ncbi:MAG: CBS domain-containing protein [Ignavibacteriales bacterium]|nr:CBS domain-containing protein [Ignavibacteriales bacterium]
MITARTLLDSKEGVVWSVAPDTMVIDALRLMAEKNIGALIVVANDVIQGILSERDYARKIVLRGESSRTTAVKDIMSRKVFTVRQDQSIGDCMALMTNNRIRHLPVVDNQKILGLISIGDVVKAIISDQAETIKHLENYISGAS